MDQIARQKQIDIKKFQGDKNLETRYSLPSEVKYCRKCVMSNQRPVSVVEHRAKTDDAKNTLAFDESGVCDACNFALRKSKINWHERRELLHDLCLKHKSKYDSSFNCVVPGSGGKDSFYAAHVLKYEFGMRPLTVTWSPNIYTDWGWKNHQAWLAAGFDNVLITPNKRTHRLLTRLSTEILFHPFQPFIIGQKLIAEKIANQYDIPLIFYGENEAEYGNPLSENDSSLRDKKFASTTDFESIVLGGVSVADLRSYFGLDDSDLAFYLPLDQRDLHRKRIETHYLGYYLRWHPQSCYYYSVENGGFEAAPERSPGTYSKYNSIDDKVDDFHYFTTRIKFGIGRATYDASQEIRSGDIEREEGVSLVRQFDHEFPQRFAEEFFQHISLPKDDFPVASNMFECPKMNLEYFCEVADSFRSPHLWKYTDGEWCLRHPLY